MMTHDDWTRRLRDRLANREAEPPEDLWSGIMDAMDQRRRKARTVRMRFRAAAAAAVVAVVAGVGYYMERAGSDGMIAESRKYNAGGEAAYREPVGRDVAAPGGNDAALGTMDAAGATATIKTPDAGCMQTARHAGGDSRVVENKEDEALQGFPHKSEPESEKKDDKPAGGTERGWQGRSEGSTRQNATAMRDSHAMLAAADNERWSVGIHSAGGFGNSSASVGVMPANTIMSDMVMPEGALRSTLIPLANHKEKKKHYQPVAFGVSVSYALNDRLALRSGVVYTKASSDFTRIAGTSRVKDEQRLHYVGVPLGVSYNVWQSNRFKAYVAADAQADFNVKATVETDGVKADMEKDRLQWSVGAAAGVEYDIVPQLGVYAEPGMKYYIDNGSEVETFYKENKLRFSLQVGLRLVIK